MQQLPEVESPLCSVGLDDVRVPAENQVGEENAA
jgi:alkylation response protein AidB-like acyl-CoA dehydrogenase